MEENNLVEGCELLFAGQKIIIPVGVQSATTVSPISPTPPRPVMTRTAEIDGMELVYVPSGLFQMGAAEDDLAATDSEQPQHAVFLDAYWIDRTEISNGSYARCVQAGKCRPPASKSSKTRLIYYGDSRFSAYPVIFVSWSDAEAYCHWAGRRLPTEAEWEKAARGVDGRLYPWGDNKPTVSLANLDNLVGDTMPVESYPSSASPFGAFNMAGNVSEWVADWYDKTYYAISPALNPPGPLEGVFRVLRGGSWFSRISAARAAHRLWNYPDQSFDSNGFRCAVSP